MAVRAYFLRLTIAGKMLLGYISLVGLLALVSVYALVNLNNLNSINTSILETDVPVIDAADKMIDAVLAQELYARRYLILSTPEMLKIFWARSQEFDELLGRVRSMPEERRFPVETLGRLHRQYNEILIHGMDERSLPGREGGSDFDERVKALQEQLVDRIKEMSAVALRDQNEKTGRTATLGHLAYQAAWVMGAVALALSLIAAGLITRNISGAIRKLKFATEMIAEGKFDYEPNITNKDELGDLATAFTTMAKRLKRLEEMYLDASPLTRLPGGIAIENILRKRIESGEPFAFCLADLDNFKAYNDRYGYAKGNEVIQATATIIEDVVSTHGGDDDFVGHVGGDDFAILTSPDRFARICTRVIDRFDERIPGFYDEEDRRRGAISGKDRQGRETDFPLATLSIAVVTNKTVEVESHIRVGEIAAELKEYAKTIPGSVYIVDQRRDEKARGEREGNNGNVLPFPDSSGSSKG